MIGGARWKRQTARDVEKLAARSPSADVRSARYDRLMLVGLPTPVVRYFEFALTPGQPMIESARIEWVGEFSIRPRRWSAFAATQHYRVRPPGFVWDARIHMAPAVPVLVRDAYLEHEGSLRAAIGGVIDVANVHGTPEMAEGELLRYLGEAVWYPTALLPCAGVSWRPLDHCSATATLSDGATTVSMVAHFASTGEITGLTAMRPREVRGTTVLTPWVAHLSDYSARSGMQVPSAGDVEWTLSTGPLPYWRGRIVNVHYDFAD
jgi:hypothetical protein